MDESTRRKDTTTRQVGTGGWRWQEVIYEGYPYLHRECSQDRRKRGRQNSIEEVRERGRERERGDWERRKYAKRKRRDANEKLKGQRREERGRDFRCPHSHWVKWTEWTEYSRRKSREERNGGREKRRVWQNERDVWTDHLPSPSYLTNREDERVWGIERAIISEGIPNERKRGQWRLDEERVE